MSIHVLQTPMHVERTERADVLWCFGCRKRVTGTWSFMVCDDPLSYYGPHWQYACNRCGRDRRIGFGA